MENALPPDFKEFLNLLNVREVEYLLIGGYAVSFHGYPRVTNDIDLWVAVNPANAHKLIAVLRAFGFDTPELTPELFLKDRSIVRMGHPPMRIEITTGIDGVRFDDCYPRRTVAMIDGILVNVISREDLKTNKRASGRLKDLADLENLP